MLQRRERGLLPHQLDRDPSHPIEPVFHADGLVFAGVTGLALHHQILVAAEVGLGLADKGHDVVLVCHPDSAIREQPPGVGRVVQTDVRFT